MARSPDKSESTAFSERLRRLFTRELPIDEAARAAIQRMDDAEQRIQCVRKEVTDGIRRKNGRFHL